MTRKVRGSDTGRPIMVLLDALGERWTLRILWELRDTHLTFRALRARCDNVSPTSLNNRLKQLRELKLIERYDDGYGYTSYGRELSEHLISLSVWAEQWGKELN